MIRLLGGIVPEPSRGRFRRLVAGSVAASVAGGLAYVVLVPLLRALFAEDMTTAWLWAGVLAAACAAYSVLTVWTTSVGVALGIDLLRETHRRIGDHTAALPLAWFGPERTGALGRMAGRGAMDVAMVPARLVRPLVSAVVTPLTLVVAMVLFDWRMGVALLVCVPVVAGGARALAAMVGRGEAAEHAATAAACDRVVEFARHQAVLRSAGRTADSTERALREQHAARRRSLFGGSVGAAVFLLVLQLALTAILAWGTYLALGGGLRVVELIALLVLAARSVDPLVQAGELSAVLRVATEAVRRMTDLLTTPTLPEPARPAAPADASVEFDHVTFGYDGTPVLRDVSFTVPAGTTTAIVGASGAGKTTVTRLVARFADPDDGAVRIGGRDLRELGTAVVLDHVSVVFQQVYLFDDTLWENIRVGRPDADDAEIERAARMARVDEIVRRLPRGWDTPVGEGGAALSGGERQRVSIARALLKDAPVVLLDEATAALDAENEAAVRDALDALGRDRTVLVVAHRLATIAAADQILVMGSGTVVERGAHDDLLAAGGAYARLWASRERAEGWRLTRPAR
ncbi:ABC transporter ATP-binding protein [Actinokineospora sp. UTMC 2448]|uniref:ABC transporter ATP-binding protein n=1 Tax=Actinokineospora sp. UTMC 2448 TaxID=2268449 RepID=UPI00216452CF|nr:ABC transporter ATP-binding protein [Actinokineospora sp. UTMC 2448]UVS79543.1 Iron import ATP-binding/permease protein IrtB [Actinokineospora sp. UTMC 2448]